MKKHIIFHIDVNSAFVSWEGARRVALGLDDVRRIPSVVGGDPSSRTSVVCAKSIPAKKYGINVGEPVSMAIRKCPGLVVIRADFELYRQCSRAFIGICREYSDLLEQFSIDECFLDMSRHDGCMDDPVAVARELADRIKNELGFTVNIGVSENKLLAKMASDFEKPDRVHTLWPEEIKTKMWPLPVGDLLFVGKASSARLKDFGIRTIGDLANCDRNSLISIFGEKAGSSMIRSANGKGSSEIITDYGEAKSISMSTTTEEDIIDFERADAILAWLVDAVCFRLRKNETRACCIGVNIRSNSFDNKSHQKKLDSPTDITSEILAECRHLFRGLWKGEPLRLMGVTLSDFNSEGFEQTSIFDDDNKKEKNRKLDKALDTLRLSYGKDIVVRATDLVANTRKSH